MRFSGLGCARCGARRCPAGGCRRGPARRLRRSSRPRRCRSCRPSRGRVEVARRQVEAQVAALVGHVGLHQRHVGHQRALHHVGLAVELAQLLALGHHGADAGLGEERRDAGAAGAQLLGQRALRRELELEFAGQVLALELLVLADVADEIIFLICRVCSSLPRPKSSTPGVVGDDGEVLDAAVAHGVDQRLGDAAQAEAADGEQLAAAHHAVDGRRRGGIELVQGGVSFADERRAGDAGEPGYDTTYRAT
jgi:hypothetical protein